MRYQILLLLGMVVWLPGMAMASLVTHESDVPYDIVTLEQITSQQYIVGTLTDFPEMYEFTIDATTTLALALNYPMTAAVTDTSIAPQLGIIIVQVIEPRGVAEIARLTAAEAQWGMVRDPLSRLPYLAGPTFLQELSPGTYRVEVSTPENTSNYMLVVGTADPALTFGEKFTLVGQLYDFYGVSKIGMVRSPLVIYPIGIAVLLGLIAATWWFGRRRR